MRWACKHNYIAWETDKGNRFIFGSIGYAFILVWLIACLVASTILSVDAVREYACADMVDMGALLHIALPALAGASFCYIRRMYHAAFRGEPIDATGRDDDWVRVGTYVYFFTRPFFVAMTVLLLLLLAALGVSSLLAGSIDIKGQGFVLLAVLAATLGFRGGSSLDDLSRLSNAIRKRLSDSVEEQA